MPRLPLKEYAELVCDAVGQYAFPGVTVTFEGDGEDETITPHCYTMSMVEKHIRDLLCRPDPADVRDGLSNVLYWGWAREPELGKFRVKKFRRRVRRVVGDDPNPGPNGSKRVFAVGKLGGFSKRLTGTPSERLRQIRRLRLPEFGRMSFATKILMFLDPENCPVLDQKIARAFARPCRPPLQNLDMLRPDIPIKKRNAAAYESWARWCQAIAATVNADGASPRHDLRAVDVERALFTLVDKGDAEGVRRLRQGPRGWKLRSEFE